MILSVRKSEQINQKLLELVSHYSKVTKYVSIQKSITFLYSSNEQVEFEIENTIPIILATPKMKFLCINQTKCVQDLCEENYTILNEQNKKRAKQIHSMFMGSKTQYCQDSSSSQLDRFNSIPVRIPANCFVYIDKLILQFIQRGERPRTANTILKGKSKIGGLTLANLSLIIKLQ